MARVQDGGFYGWPWYYVGDKEQRLSMTSRRLVRRARLKLSTSTGQDGRLDRAAAASTPLSDEISRNLAMDLGADAHPSRMMTISSEDISGLLDVVEATDAIFFGIFATAKARIAAGKLQAIEVQPHFQRLGRYALVTMAGRSESPPLELFRSFAHAHFHD
jgi:hypothetical protein